MKTDKWFAARRYGYGSALPLRWQGWALFVGLLGTIALATRLDGAARWIAIGVILVILLPIIAAKTEGGWRWRWGP